MSEIPRARTGAPGLDELLEGGLPRNYVYSIVGPPGSGKTIFGSQFLYRGATMYAENGILVSLEEPPHSIANSMMRFNWNLFDLESQGKMVLLDASPTQDRPGAALKIKGGVLGNETYDLDGLIGAIGHGRKRVAAKRCVIDSLSSMLGAYRSESEFRFRLIQFFRALSQLELTTLVLTESPTPLVGNYGMESILANGSFLLHTVTEKEKVFQVLEIQKMRGVRVQRRLVPYSVTPDGFEVRPQDPAFPEAR